MLLNWSNGLIFFTPKYFLNENIDLELMSLTQKRLEIMVIFNQIFARNNTRVVKCDHLDFLTIHFSTSVLSFFFIFAGTGQINHSYFQQRNF